MPLIVNARELARSHGLRYVAARSLKLLRKRRGRSFSYHLPDGSLIADEAVIARLKRLRVPPAYRDVRYSALANAHLQAVGTDALGRLQYRYHPGWAAVREEIKARRLASLAGLLPRIHRALGQYLARELPDKSYAAAAALLLISETAIRPGDETYLRERGTRGATTLLKSNVSLSGSTIMLRFKAKGAKVAIRQVTSQRLARVLAPLLELPGRRLFQYRGEDGRVHQLRSTDLRTFLLSLTQVPVSPKDFRTLSASMNVLKQLAPQAPAASKAGRARQIRDAIVRAAEELLNTPAVCKASYVHEAVTAAFESGLLRQLASEPGAGQSAARWAELLLKLIEMHRAGGGEDGEQSA